MRVTGGSLGGRRLRAPRGGARPTTDRVRESLFAWLGDVTGAVVLDLYAGSGALGIEALSRGAESVVFVERSVQSLTTLRWNLESLKLGMRSSIVRGDVLRCVRRLGRGGSRFDLVLVDPPYASSEGRRALSSLVHAEVLAPGATVVVERSRRHPLPSVPGLAIVAERRYGDTVISRFERDEAGGSNSE